MSTPHSILFCFTFKFFGVRSNRMCNFHFPPWAFVWRLEVLNKKELLFFQFSFRYWVVPARKEQRFLSLILPTCLDVKWIPLTFSLSPTKIYTQNGNDGKKRESLAPMCNAADGEGSISFSYFPLFFSFYFCIWEDECWLRSRVGASNKIGNQKRERKYKGEGESGQRIGLGKKTLMTDFIANWTGDVNWIAEARNRTSTCRRKARLLATRREHDRPLSLRESREAKSGYFFVVWLDRDRGRRSSRCCISIIYPSLFFSPSKRLLRVVSRVKTNSFTSVEFRKKDFSLC